MKNQRKITSRGVIVYLMWQLTVENSNRFLQCLILKIQHSVGPSTRQRFSFFFPVFTTVGLFISSHSDLFIAYRKLKFKVKIRDSG